MNAYESMLLTDAANLEKTIEDLISKSINDDADAKGELVKVEAVIDFDYEISADVTFCPSSTTLYSTATFDSITKFNDAAEEEDGYSYDFENEYGLTWDDDCSYGEFELDKTDTKVSVDINGLTENASQEAKDGYLAVLMVKRNEEERKQQEELVERLRKQLKAAEEKLKG
tara:strand:+ start:646 stop:1158 length:513 start_codon:yes stop_codon:yes gene_type:complete